MFKDLLEIKPEEEVSKIVAFLKKTFSEQKIEKAVIGVSGGIDSSVSLSLLGKVLSSENIQLMHLPYIKDDSSDVYELMKSLNIQKNRLNIFSIKNMTDNLIKELDIPKDDLIRRGNIMARARMITLFDYAKKNGAMVVGTENRSEHFLGYFTRFGDAASDIEPIAHLYKTQVYELANHLGVPDSIINKAPSAGLWGNQTDEGEFGFTYKEADPVLLLYFDKKNSAYSIEQMYPGAKKIIEYAEKYSFKNKVPYSL